jgi:aspartyl-tRNA(Asn)/glutamyl-tRNA(Gln) amidotransferase subunit C
MRDRLFIVKTRSTGTFMSDAITKELFDHLVQLAALDMSPEEASYLRRELNNQLKVINELAAIPLDDDLPIASHGVPYPEQTRPPLRSDTWIPYTDPQSIIEQAPQSDDGYIVVPDIPHSDLE